jgi:hypothetical protein
MMMLPSGVKVRIAAGVTDMRKGMDGLASWSRVCCAPTRSRTGYNLSRSALCPCRSYDWTYD